MNIKRKREREREREREERESERESERVRAEGERERERKQEGNIKKCNENLHDFSIFSFQLLTLSSLSFNFT